MASGTKNIENAHVTPGQSGDVTQDYSGGAAHVATDSGVDSDGNRVVPILPLTYANDGTNITSISFTDGANTWTQTLSYSGGILTGKSIWVKT